MDWLLDTRRADATAVAAKALEEHLRRHANDESAVSEAVEVARRTWESASGDLLWLHVDWIGVQPILTVSPVASNAVALPESGFTQVGALDRRTLSEASDGASRSEDLMVPREDVMSFDPDVAALETLDPLAQGAASAAIALAAATEAHPVATADQVAAAAGAMLADASLDDGHRVESASDVVAAFGRVHEALGGGYREVRSDDDHIELAIDKSPFGEGLRSTPSLSRLTEGLAGRIAARVRGKATVVHDETIGVGDPADRLRILLGEVEQEVIGSTYLWPPAGTHDKDDTSPRLEMTVSLPRQSHSVPVIRRLAAQILRAFGVAADSIHDVELAISEACANVIQHAVDSEGYEVSIELAADRCAITVLDRGEGFEPSEVGAEEDFDAESGRGLSLMRALVDNLDFVSEPKIGAVVHMVKQLDYDDSHPFRRSAS